MKLHLDFVFKDHFPPAFLPEIPPGNFLSLPEISNLTLRQYLHDPRNVAILIYKHCSAPIRVQFNFTEHFESNLK